MEYYSQPTPEAPSFNEERVVSRFRLWIDTHTNQILQYRGSLTYLSGQRGGHVEGQEFRVVLDEIRDLSEFPPGHFEFKLPPGAELVVPTPEATSMPTAAPQR